MDKILKKVGIGKRRRLQNLKPTKKTYSSNPNFHQRKQKQHTLRSFLWVWIRKKDGWVWLTIFFIIFSGGVVLTFFTPFMEISEVKIEGNKNIAYEELDGIINNYLGSNKLFIFPKKNFLFFGAEEAQAQVRENLNNQFALEDIDIIKNFPDNIEVRVLERIPGLLWISDNKKYLLDINGIPSEELQNKEDEGKYPHIIDKNKKPIQTGKQVISKDLVDFILILNKTFEEKTGLKIREYSIPQVQCQEKVYVAEKILTEEVEEEDDEKLKEKKKEILKQYNTGKITIEESLEKLEQVKKDSNKEKNKNKNQDDSADEFIQWQTVYEPVECDLVKVNSEINILVEDDYEIYFDSKLDLDMQINNLKNVLKETIDDPKAIDYIDLRFPDRVYYK